MGKHNILLTFWSCIILSYRSSCLLFFSAKARPSKKARLNKPTDHEPATEPEKTPEAIDPEADTVTDNPEPQATDTLVEPVENNPPSQSADPLSPTVDPPSPAKESDKPPSPTKTTDDDVVVTGLALVSAPLVVLRSE